MSIFDDNITNKFRGEELMKRAAYLVGEVVDRELCHYNSDSSHINDEIIREFAINDILFNKHFKIKSQIYSKIHHVLVSPSGAITERGIPIYKVSVYTVDWIDDTRTNYYFPLLINLYASVGGVIHECF